MAFHSRLAFPTSKQLYQPLGYPRQRILRGPNRSLSTEYAPKSVLSSPGPVHLEFDRYEVYADGEQRPGGPLVILHGFLGSKRNWSTLSKAFSKHLRRPVYALDLRNQGSSPHVHSMSYTDMASDVALFMETQKLTDVTLLGHSMGGKVAMTVALGKDTRAAISKLVVVDIGPSQAKLSPSFAGYIEGMRKVADSGVVTRKEATEIMKEYEQDPSLLSFLLTNVQQAPPSDPPKPLQFRIPLPVIAAAIPDIGTFPYSPDDNHRATWDGPTLIIKGSRSNYINHKNIPLFNHFFPNMRLAELDTSHWVHAEKPADFKDLVTGFIDGAEAAA